MILTPTQIRECIAEFYVREALRLGRAVNRAEIDKRVVAELTLVDAARRISTPRKTKRATPAQPTTGEKLAADGMRLVKGERSDAPYRPAMMYANPVLVSEQWAAATVRVQQILQGSGGKNLVDATKNAEVPKLAKKFLDVYAHYMLRGKPAPIRGVDHNPFRGLSDRDASRAYIRFVMDICDESVRYLGHWWVK